MVDKPNLKPIHPFLTRLYNRGILGEGAPLADFKVERGVEGATWNVEEGKMETQGIQGYNKPN